MDKIMDKTDCLLNLGTGYLQIAILHCTIMEMLAIWRKNIFKKLINL